MQTYDRPTPETDAFIGRIDDSEIDLCAVESTLRDMECERDYAREVIRKMIQSAHPCPVNNPSMHAAWAEAREMLKDNL